MSERMDSKTVDAFADKLKSVWLHGYHDQFSGKLCNVESVRRRGRESLLGEVYTHGYEAGKEDVVDRGEWTDEQALSKREESDDRATGHHSWPLYGLED